MPLQKSLSEQNGSHRNRQWNKTRSHSAAHHPNTTRNAVSKPLQPISAASRNKLNAFKCPNPAKSNDDETQTPIPVISVDGPPNDEGNPTKQAGKGTPDENTHIPASRDSVATPVSRLAWQDLIGKTEIREKEDETSPNDKIGWDTREDSQQGLKMSPVMPGRRGKKRARSSSPVSSPANSKPHTPAVNVEKLSRALKSPHADPAMELWDRFSLGGPTTITPIGAMNSALAQIMVSSSPRPSRTPGEGGLRRAISCGANWPKRRRVERAEAPRPMDVIVDESPSGGSKSSMVNALLQTVNGEINKSKAIKTHHHSAKSPSPNKKRAPTIAQPSGSPTRRKSPSKPVLPSNVDRTAQTTDKPRPNASMDALSDYGDDDFDDDTLMELDASVYQTREEHAQADIKVPTADTGQDPVQQQPLQGSESSDDEFADMDDDVFAAAENLMTQIDSSHNPVDKPDTLPQTSVAAQEKPTDVANDFAEDAFEDDFGDFDFEAAEIAATQSASSKKANGSLPVRTWQ
ncbi:hypothetical protein GGR52DRAFT_387905 [Hypoxylon sp. FL1284]|nr:hypothetical protein GGR52DRAFT_387905 [Hypoxylon sp. FL1284]